ncbi:right-handed parallel beta-helix repeat-containing protein [Candidatus Woesearchaeota archaeon]|nr:right-handed parallel beta-helix repeat-containing protein [Candidatus Woesearchaeota archaeon]
MSPLFGSTVYRLAPAIIGAVLIDFAGHYFTGPEAKHASFESSPTISSKPFYPEPQSKIPLQISRFESPPDTLYGRSHLTGTIENSVLRASNFGVADGDSVTLRDVVLEITGEGPHRGIYTGSGASLVFDHVKVRSLDGKPYAFEMMKPRVVDWSSVEISSVSDPLSSLARDPRASGTIERGVHLFLAGTPSSISLDNCYLHGNAVGLGVEGGSPSRVPVNLSVRDCLFEDQTYNGIFLSGLQGEPVMSITGTVFRGVGEHCGVMAIDTENLHVENDYFTDVPSGAGVMFINSANGRFYRNIFTENLWKGLTVDHSDSASVTGNDFAEITTSLGKDPAEAFQVLKSSSRVYLSGNLFDSNTIALRVGGPPASDLKVAANVFRGNTYVVRYDYDVPPLDLARNSFVATPLTVTPVSGINR